MDKKYMGNQYETAAIESLFSDLETRDAFETPQKIYVEVSSRDKEAQAFYAKFGFSRENCMTYAGVIRMSVQSKKIRVLFAEAGS